VQTHTFLQTCIIDIQMPGESLTYVNIVQIMREHGCTLKSHQKTEEKEIAMSGQCHRLHDYKYLNLALNKILDNNNMS